MIVFLRLESMGIKEIYLFMCIQYAIYDLASNDYCVCQVEV